MNNKKELQEALDKVDTWLDDLVDVIESNKNYDDSQIPEIRKVKKLLQNHINSLPDNYEPVLKEIKLSELIERLKRIYSCGQIDYLRISLNDGIWIKYFIDEYEITLVKIKNNKITYANVHYDNADFDWLYLMKIYKTKIIDDLEGNSNAKT